MTKIPKARGNTWEDFAPTREQKKLEVLFMKVLKEYYDTKVQPTYKNKKPEGASMSMLGRWRG